MDYNQPQSSQNISWWIASLAASVVLCAVFAGYVFDIKEDLKNARIRADIMEQRMDMVVSEVDNLRRRTLVQQIQLVPSDKTPQPPAAATAPAQAAPTTAAPGVELPLLPAPTVPNVTPPSMPVPPSPVPAAPAQKP